jgi:DNA uptake protein ComE-like DNA-binding protein
MSNPFKQFVNQFNKYSRSDRNAILILSGIILIVITANIILDNIESKPKFDSSEYEKIAAELEAAINGNSIKQSLFCFNPNSISESQLDSLLLPSKIKQNLLAYRKAGGKFYSVNSFRKLYGMNDSIFKAVEQYIVIEERRAKKELPKIISKKKITGYFNPNKANFVELKKFGFSNYQAKNLIKYRDKGGVFKKVDDVLKIYGIDSIFFKTIETHIQIENQIETPVKEKIVEVSKIELNEVDSAGLVKLPGIGSVYAIRIIKYRELLGGYYSKKQLLEVYNFPEDTFLNIKKFISVDSLLIRKIRINFAEFKDLLRHPYLDKKQVEAILYYKENNGAFESISTLQLIDEIDPITYSKIKPYFTCR